MKRITIAVNLSNQAVSQYTHYDFNSFAVFNGKLLGGNESGLFELNTGEDFYGTDIDAYVILPLTDFGVSSLKRIRKINASIITDGTVEFTVYAEGVEEVIESDVIGVVTGVLTLMQTGMYFSRNLLGSYFKLKIGNVDGCDFSINSVEVAPVVLPRRSLN